jgi:hypothetical protein
LLESLTGKVDTTWWRRIRRLRLQPLIFRIAFKMGPTRMTRDVRIIQRELVAQGRAVWLGETFPQGPAPPPLTDVPRAVARVRAMFEDSETSLQPTVSDAADRARPRNVDAQVEAAPS